MVFNCLCFRNRFYIGHWIGSFTSGTSKGTSLSLFLRISASKRRVLSLGAKFSSCIFIQVASAFRQSLVSSDKKKKTMSVQSRYAHPLFAISAPTHETYCRGVTNSGTCHLCHTRTAWQSCPPCSQGAPSGEREIQTVIHYWSIANHFFRHDGRETLTCWAAIHFSANHCRRVGRALRPEVCT